MDSFCVDQGGDEELYDGFVNQFCQMLPGITTKLVKRLQRASAGSAARLAPSVKITERCLQGPMS
jgi:hypothetical protein